MTHSTRASLKPTGLKTGSLNPTRPSPLSRDATRKQKIEKGEINNVPSLCESAYTKRGINRENPPLSGGYLSVKRILSNFLPLFFILFGLLVLQTHRIVLYYYWAGYAREQHVLIINVNSDKIREPGLFILQISGQYPFFIVFLFAWICMV